MRKRQRISYSLGISTFLIFATVNAFACFCGGGNSKSTMRETVAAYSAGATQVIFEGSVEKQELQSGSPGAPAAALSMTGFGSHRVVTFNVLRAYRGKASGNVTGLTGLSGGDCGFDFESGKKYLVYASRVNTDFLFTSICSGTSSLGEAGPALRYLRGEPPTPDDLLDLRSYYEKFKQQYGSACGRVTRLDGSPVGGASVDMTQVRDEPFPPKLASDPDMSKPDGSFCIPGISPGKYVLTAETTDFDHDLRWMGYYPGVPKHADATVIEVKSGAKLQNLNFTVRKESLYTVSFRIKASDGSPVSLNNLRVRIDSPDRDELAYHLDQHEDQAGEFIMGYVPPGHYVVRTYIQVNDPEQAVPVELTKWRMANQEVDIKSDANIVLKLTPAN
jgi:hypothetical protein